MQFNPDKYKQAVKLSFPREKKQLLFIIFIKELEKELKSSNCRGISLASAVGIFLVMYADDIALIADTSVELQRKLKALESFVKNREWK